MMLVLIDINFAFLLVHRRGAAEQSDDNAFTMSLLFGNGGGDAR